MSSFLRHCIATWLQDEAVNAVGTGTSAGLNTGEIESLKLEFNLRVEEYKNLRAESQQHILFQHQMMTTSFAGIAALVVGAKFIRDEVPFLFIIASWVFFGLIWTQLRYARVVADIDRHITHVTKQDFVTLLKRLAMEEQESSRSVLASHGRVGSSIYGKGVMGLVLDGARYGIPLIVTILLSSAYFAIFLTCLHWRHLLVALLQMALIAFTIQSILRVRSEAVTSFESKSL